MDPVAAAVLASWTLDLKTVGLLLAVAALYLRGWLRLRAELPRKYTAGRLAAFAGGLVAILLALASPVDAFGDMLLSAHMIQHLLLIMVAPPLVLLGQPVLPLLRGLPRWIFKDALGPFLRWRELKKVGRAIVHPIVSWFTFAIVIIVWHLPRFYELALHSQAWHQGEHACFFWSAMAFWWPVIGVWPSHPIWPQMGDDSVPPAGGPGEHWPFRGAELLGPRTLSELSTGTPAVGHLRSRRSSRGGSHHVGARIDRVSVTGGDAGNASPGAGRHPSDSTEYARSGFRVVPAKGPWDLLRTPILGPILRHRHFRRCVQAAMLLLAAVVAVDGFFGPQIAPMNLAGVLPWTYWRGLAVIALVMAGNLFCMACPFTLPRDLARRFVSPRYRWPRRLRSKWIAAGLLAAYFWAYDAFSLWDSPRSTAWIILGYFLAAFVVDSCLQRSQLLQVRLPDWPVPFRSLTGLAVAGEGARASGLRIVQHARLHSRKRSTARM